MDKRFAKFLFAALALIFAPAVAMRAQRIAVIVPDETAVAARFADEFETAIGRGTRVVDRALASAGFRSANPETPFNMSVEQARIIGAAIGCEYVILIRADAINRYSLGKKEYTEAFAAVYTVSTRTGRLVDFRISSAEGKKAESGEELVASAPKVAAELLAKLPAVTKREIAERPSERFPEVPPEDSAEARGFRPAMPYRRVTPKYTVTADLYAVAATVDIEVEIDAFGTIARAEIVRWAGFGLDESVEQAIRSMNWRPAERDGRPVPVRVLLRYNFRKILESEIGECRETDYPTAVNRPVSLPPVLRSNFGTDC